MVKVPAVLTNPDLPEREGVKAEYLKIHSAAKVSEQFDSNIFLDDSDNKLDFITILSPSVGFEMKAGRDCDISADYEISKFLYGNYKEQGHVDNTARFLSEVRFGDYKFIVNDELRMFTDRASTEDSLRLKENVNGLKTGISAQFVKFGFDTGYINKLQTYDSNDPSIGNLSYADRSYMDQSVYATVSYRFRPKTYLIFENDLGAINYYETSQLPDSFYYDTLFGIRGEWTNKIIVNLRAGFRYQHYDKSDIVSHKGYAGPIIRGGVEFNYTKDDKFILTLERTDHESIYATNNHYTYNLLGIRYNHRFNKKLSCGAFGTYELHAYPSETIENGVTAKRNDNFLYGGVNLRYDMRKWASVEAKYEYRQRISTFDVFDYKDNLITVTGTVGF